MTDQTSSPERSALVLIPFDRSCLDLSWRWLNDPEIRKLTMSPVFSRDDQDAFFRSLPTRSGYWIWGVALRSGEIIGATGLKNFRGALAEYWGYIGERQYWSRGLGKLMVAQVEQKARAAGIEQLDLRVSGDNYRAIRLYERIGYTQCGHDPSGACLRMVKRKLDAH